VTTAKVTVTQLKTAPRALSVYRETEIQPYLAIPSVEEDLKKTLTTVSSQLLQSHPRTLFIAVAGTTVGVGRRVASVMEIVTLIRIVDLVSFVFRETETPSSLHTPNVKVAPRKMSITVSQSHLKRTPFITAAGHSAAKTTSAETAREIVTQTTTANLAMSVSRETEILRCLDMQNVQVDPREITTTVSPSSVSSKRDKLS
jgi:hypothetical protein